MPITDFNYDKDAPNLIADDFGRVAGIVTGWNPHGSGECITQYFDGSASSEYFNELNFPNGKERAREWLTKRER